MKQTNLKQTYAKYVSLSILGMIGLSCYILADTFFVARGIGANGLTALNLAIPIYSFVHGTGLMIGMGGATRFAISKSKHTFTQSTYFVLISSFLFLTAGLFFSVTIASLLGANHDVIQNTSIYLKTILCFSPMFLLNNLILCFVRNDNNPKLSMLAMLLGSLSNIVLDYIFIFPFNMGMFGAALATGIAPIVSLLILSIHFIRKQNSFCIHWIKPKLKIFADISSLGVSALITELSSGIVMIVFNAIILNLAGNIGVAAYGIIANIALVILSIFTGISQGVQPMISNFHGKKQYEDIKIILKYAFTTAVSIAAVVYAVSFLLANPIVSAFNQEANVTLANIAAGGMRLYFTAFLFAGINILCSAYFSAIDRPKSAFIISTLRGFLVILPISLLLSALFGINGVWLSMTCSELIVLVVSLSLLKAKADNNH